MLILGKNEKEYEMGFKLNITMEVIYKSVWAGSLRIWYCV